MRLKLKAQSRNEEKAESSKRKGIREKAESSKLKVQM